MTTAQRLLYHFTHIDNLPSILAAGALACDRAADRLVSDVGDQDVKSLRRSKELPPPSEGVVADYVPFYFAARSPMLYRIACDHRDSIPGRYPGGEEPLVYLVTSIETVLKAGLTWVASDGNCASAVTTYTSDASALDSHVDWPLMRQAMWNNTPTDPDRMRRRMAEFLVHRALPVDLLLGMAVMTRTTESGVRGILDQAGKSDMHVAVRPAWYYGSAPGR